MGVADTSRTSRFNLQMDVFVNYEHNEYYKNTTVYPDLQEWILIFSTGSFIHSYRATNELLALLHDRSVDLGPFCYASALP